MIARSKVEKISDRFSAPVQSRSKRNKVNFFIFWIRRTREYV